MTDEANDLRDGTGPLPAELRRPLADLLDALERWEWVGTDKTMDEWLRSSPGLSEAYHTMRKAIADRIPRDEVDRLRELIEALGLPALEPWQESVMRAVFAGRP